MEITINSTAKEIAALVVGIQERQASELYIDGKRISESIHRSMQNNCVRKGP